jgi:hypothetical protein
MANFPMIDHVTFARLLTKGLRIFSSGIQEECVLVSSLPIRRNHRSLVISFVTYIVIQAGEGSQ